VGTKDGDSAEVDFGGGLAEGFEALFLEPSQGIQFFSPLQENLGSFFGKPDVQSRRSDVLRVYARSCARGR